MSAHTMPLSRLASHLAGALVMPEAPEYDAARRVWNGAVDKRPAAIAYCLGPDDVCRAIEAAREAGLKLSVRSGGHNVAGRSVAESGLVIDVSRMKTTVLGDGWIRADAGLTLGEFDAATQVSGLATTMGVNGTTGIAGLTLGGGFGKLGRRFGLACDNLTGAEVVTPDGRVLQVSAEKEPDLLWGLRGGGGGLGIVTRLDYRLHRIGTEVTTIDWTFPWAKLREGLRLAWDYGVAAPDEINLDIALFTSGGERMLGVSAFHAGPADAARALLAPLGRAAAALGVEPRPARRSYVAVQTASNAIFPKGRRYFWKAQFMEQLPDAAIEAIAAHFPAVPSAEAMLVFQHLGGAIARVAPDATAFAHRAAAYDCFPVAIWDDPADDARQAAWVRDLWAALQPFSNGGVYVNNLGEEGEARLRAAYGGNWPRLSSLKARLDPEGLLAGA